jgi:AP endonuclease 1
MAPAGIAVLSKIKPIGVTREIPGHPDPASVKGRIITLEFEHCYIVATYVVNAGQNLKVASLSIP